MVLPTTQAVLVYPQGYAYQSLNTTDLNNRLADGGEVNSWLQFHRSRVRFPAVPDFLRSSGSETGYVQTLEDN
jgi:hypothetical protein